MTNALHDLEHKHAGLKTINKVDPDVENHIRSIMSYNVVKAVFFATLLYGDLPLAYSEEIPVAATDGLRCYVSPSNFMTRSLAHGSFITCHEVMHYVRGDCITMHKWLKEQKVLVPSGAWLKYNQELMNIAEDYVINAAL